MAGCLSEEKNVLIWVCHLRLVLACVNLDTVWINGLLYDVSSSVIIKSHFTNGHYFFSLSGREINVTCSAISFLLLLLS